MVKISTPENLFIWLRSSGILKKYGLQKVGIFGSFARGENYNDIDFLIEDEVVNWKNLMDFQNEFQAITGQKADIMVKAYAEPLVLKTAFRDFLYETIR
jgi:predicted nucleotidyltransferase